MYLMLNILGEERSVMSHSQDDARFECEEIYKTLQAGGFENTCDLQQLFTGIKERSSLALDTN